MIDSVVFFIMEIWKDIEGFESLFQVSNLGRVKNLDHYVNGPYGLRFVKEKVRAVTPNKNDNDRCRVSLKGYPYLVSRLVAQAFIPNPDNLPEVRHKDDNPANNNVQNLEWGTHQDNMNDMMERDRYAKGDRLPHTKLTESQIIEIRSRYTGKRGEFTTLGLEYGVQGNTISRIIKKTRWSWL